MLQSRLDCGTLQNSPVALRFIRAKAKVPTMAYKAQRHLPLHLSITSLTLPQCPTPSLMLLLPCQLPCCSLNTTASGPLHWFFSLSGIAKLLQPLSSLCSDVIFSKMLFSQRDLPCPPYLRLQPLLPALPAPQIPLILLYFFFPVALITF